MLCKIIYLNINNNYSLKKCRLIDCPKSYRLVEKLKWIIFNHNLMLLSSQLVGTDIKVN